METICNSFSLSVWKEEMREENKSKSLVRSPSEADLLDSLWHRLLFPPPPLFFLSFLSLWSRWR